MIYDDIFVSNFVDWVLLDEIKWIDGVGLVILIGVFEYVMCFWLDFDVLVVRDLIVVDVINVIWS